MSPHRNHSVLRQTLSLGLFLGLMPASAPAQSIGHLRGMVINARTQTPIPNAEISFVQVDFVAQTNDTGAFLISDIPVGRYTLLVRVVGFKPVLASDHVILPDTTTSLNFELEPTVTPIEGVNVLGNETVRSTPHTVDVLTSDDLPARGEIIQALEGRVPGIRLVRRRGPDGIEIREDRGLQTRGRGRGILFVVDGTVITPPLTFYIDASEVQCVEIRRGASSVLEFSRTMTEDMRGTGYGGVILIWTWGSRAPLNEECVKEPG